MSLPVGHTVLGIFYETIVLSACPELFPSRGDILRLAKMDASLDEPLYGEDGLDTVRMCLYMAFTRLSKDRQYTSFQRKRFAVLARLTQASYCLTCLVPIITKGMEVLTKE